MLQSIILGIIQGITEFLPISSSAHLILVPIIFHFNNGISDSMFFDLSLHLGTLLSIILYFYKDLLKLVKSFFTSVKNVKAKTTEEKLAWYLIFATIPTAVTGVLFEDAVENFFHSGRASSVIFIAILMTLVSFVMIFSEKFSTKKKSMAEITLKDALIIGAIQAIAIFPGTSRSAVTICAGLLLGYKREESARFSFLLATPVIFGAFLLKFIKSVGALQMNEVGMYIGGTVTSAIIGYLSIKFLIDFLANRKLNAFAYYRLILAVILIAYVEF